MVYKISAYIILIVFYGCFFIKKQSQKKKGIKTNHIGEAKEGLVKLIETAMGTASVVIVITEMVSIFLGTSGFPVYIRFIGIILASLGDAVFICAVLTMRDSWRAGVSKNDKTELVTEGIYKWSRNPAFLGFDLVYTGIALAFFNSVLLAVTIITMILFHLQIVNVEEEFLINTFGQSYLDYRKKVCRYFGRKAK
ncbi:MAG: isoprenylcysteine carboxylmethyltransferase family protein [Oscillospiraceae bacterium]|nr:isoprenylcysteine carboxylmethyltransferase family protein [Oscillospiraceae bacterium]